ncbi:MAG: hypothetical protein KatS3mg028_0679 [Bacteroidia bacterium]|nr:MAG: hypothetical protein KatS3mg028_0679 [Bacteroidia bacterium]
MACTGCSTGRGCNTLETTSKYTCGNCSTGSCNKLNVFNWLGNISEIVPEGTFPVVEVRFKHSRKNYYLNPNKYILYTGDVVVTEGDSGGYDVGTVSATGEIVRLQLRKKEIKDTASLKKIIRKARQQDLEKWKEAQTLEIPALIKSREFAQQLNLEMKLIDVEYQGDKTKATFYYTANGRVDFRELIKKLAADLKIRVEMKQIGARQEAARLGGIGVCGRELCCSTWLTDFRTVNTNNIQISTTIHQSIQTGRTMRKTQMLSKLRIGHLFRCSERISGSQRQNINHPKRQSKIYQNRCVQKNYLLGL